MARRTTLLAALALAWTSQHGGHALAFSLRSPMTMAGPANREGGKGRRGGGGGGGKRKIGTSSGGRRSRDNSKTAQEKNKEAKAVADSVWFWECVRRERALYGRGGEAAPESPVKTVAFDLRKKMGMSFR